MEPDDVLHADTVMDQAVEVSISDAATAAIKPIATPVEVTEVDGRFRVVRPATPTGIGIVLEDPANDALPTDPADPRVIDADGDGNPASPPRSRSRGPPGRDLPRPSGDLRLRPDPAEPRPARRVDHRRSEQLILGASDPLFLATAQWEQIDDPTRNPVIWQRVDAGWDCARARRRARRAVPAEPGHRLVSVGRGGPRDAPPPTG